MNSTTSKIVLFVFLGFLIAALSIGIEAYNRHPEYKENNKPSFNFLVIMLTLVVVGMAYSAFDIYMSRFSPKAILASAFVSPPA